MVVCAMDSARPSRLPTVSFLVATIALATIGGPGCVMALRPPTNTSPTSPDETASGDGSLYARLPPPPPGPPVGLSGSGAGASDPRSTAAFLSFPWPPPSPSDKLELPLSLCPGSAVTVGGVAADLLRRTARAGYSEPRFGSVPGGFALILRPERFDDEGASVADAGRWSTAYPALSFFSIDGFLSLFSGYQAHYRVIVLAVADESPLGPTHASAGRVDDFFQYRRSTAPTLPREVAAQALRPAHRCFAFVYEYVRADSSAPAVLVTRPRALPAETHLRAAGLPIP